jgi:hypothetical protein
LPIGFWSREKLMGLDERLAALVTAATEEKCPMRRLLDSLPDQTAELLSDLMNDPKMPTQRLHGAIRSEGYSLSRDSLVSHRKQRCRCFGGKA